MDSVVVLGCGRVGATIVEDIAQTHDVDVFAVDVDPATYSRIATVESNRKGGLLFELGDFLAGDKNVLARVSDARVVVNALPGRFGFDALRKLIEFGKDVVDISFPDADQLSLDRMAVESCSRVIVDAGVAPGLWNLFLGHEEHTKARVRSCACYVGGLPMERTLPWEYKAGYSPYDVLEMYTRPCRYLEEGAVETVEAMSGAHYIQFQDVGTLEAFNTDGLRSLLQTTAIENVREYTLRYPGHIEKIGLLRSMGMLDKEPIDVVDHITGVSTRVRPIDVTARLLFDGWKYDSRPRDLTAMRVDFDSTTRDGHDVATTYRLIDYSDGRNSSMARTTGYTCAAFVDRLLNDRESVDIGVSPLERLHAFYEHVLDYLYDRGVVVNVSERLVSNR